MPLVFETFYRTLQAEAEVDLRRFEQAGTHLARALDAAMTTGERFYEPEIHRLLGVVALGQGRPDEAARHYGQGHAVASELGLVASARPWPHPSRSSGRATRFRTE